MINSVFSAITITPPSGFCDDFFYERTFVGEFLEQSADTFIQKISKAASTAGLHYVNADIRVKFTSGDQLVFMAAISPDDTNSTFRGFLSSELLRRSDPDAYLKRMCQTSSNTVVHKAVSLDCMVYAKRLSMMMQQSA